MNARRRWLQRGIFGIAALMIAGCDQSKSPPADDLSAPRVRISGEPGSWTIERHGEPLFIKGGAGDIAHEKLQNMGGNVVRAYGEADRDTTLTNASKNGLLVIPGMWLPHERHGFSYADEAAVAKLADRVREMIETHKDHPDILMWALGNEMEGDGSNVLIWKTINRLAKIVKKIDDRPVLTILSSADPAKLAAFREHCPDVDVLGINSYAGLSSVFERMRQELPNTPYLICEFGTRGPWESPRAPWGAEIEQTSTEKAEMIHEFWQNHIEAHRGYCLGGFVFRWGWKQEATHTWFGLFLEDETPTSVIDGLHEAWTGKKPIAPGPVITRVWDGRRFARLPVGTTELISVQAESPLDVELRYEWRLFEESSDRHKGGDVERKPSELRGFLVDSDQPEVKLTGPPAGKYRLFVTIRDELGKAATANFPILTE